MNMQNLAALAAMAGNGNTSGIPSLSGTGKLIFNPFSFIRQFATQNAALHCMLNIWQKILIVGLFSSNLAEMIESLESIGGFSHFGTLWACVYRNAVTCTNKLHNSFRLVFQILFWGTNKFRLWCDCWLFSHSSGPVPHRPLAFAHGDVIANFNQGQYTPVVGKWIPFSSSSASFCPGKKKWNQKNVAVCQRHLSAFTLTSLVSFVRRVSCVRLPFFSAFGVKGKSM